MARTIIDCHIHPNVGSKDIHSLVANMDELDIAAAWLLSWEVGPYEFDAGGGFHTVLDPRFSGVTLAAVVEGLRLYGDRFVGGWSPDPRDRHARAKLTAAVNLHGIRICGEFKFRMRYDTHPE